MDTITTILQAQLDTANESLTSLNNKLIEVNNELNNVNANIDTVINQISSINASLAAIQDPTVSTVLNTAVTAQISSMNRATINTAQQVTP